MIEVKNYPKNKNHIIALFDFYKKINEICLSLNIKPICWGSLIYFGYSKDLSYEIHDIDLIIPLEDILKLKKYFEENKLFKIEFIEGWNSLQIYNNDLLIEFDPIEKYIENLQTDEFNFYGIKIKGISLQLLIEKYKFASEVSEDKPKEHKRKLEILQRISK